MFLRQYILPTIFLSITSVETFAEEVKDYNEEMRGFFNSMDVNGDGKVSYDELKTYPMEQWEEDIWVPVNQDGDEFLSESEYVKYIEKLEFYDHLSYDEKTRTLGPSFEDADSDSDGKISKDEALKTFDHDRIPLFGDKIDDTIKKDGMNFEKFLELLE